MLAQDFERRFDRMHGDRPVAHPAYGIDQKRNRSYVIEVGVSEEHMIDARKFVDTQITDASTRINQDVVVEQHRSGAQIATDAAAATEYSEFHCSNRYFVLNVNAPSQSLPGGLARKYEMRSTNVWL